MTKISESGQKLCSLSTEGVKSELLLHRYLVDAGRIWREVYATAVCGVPHLR